MPWALHDGLVLSAMPTARQVSKIDGPVGMITMCRVKPEVDALQYVTWHHYSPISDGRLKDLTPVIEARDVGLSMIEYGYTAVVHCAAGRNRSGLVAALMLRELHDVTGSEAVDLVRAVRPLALSNIHFETFLRGLDRPSAS